MRVYPILRLLADLAVTIPQDILETRGQMSRRQIDWEAANLAGWICLQGKKLLDAVRHPVRRLHTAQDLCPFFHDLAQFLHVFRRDGNQLLGIKRIIQRGMMHTVFHDRPGVFDIHTQPRITARTAPAFIAKTAEEVFILLDVHRHPLQNIE